MTRKEKAILAHAANNLEQRALNAAESAGRFGPESKIEGEARAFAFRVSAEYLRGLAGGHEFLPSVKKLIGVKEGA